MKPFKANRYPIEYNVDKEVLRLLSDANIKYGEYKTLLNTLEFEASYFLDSVLLTESYKSTQIEGTQISQDEMYYLKYMEKNDDNLEIQNLKKTIMYAFDRIQKGDKIDIGLVNDKRVREKPGTDSHNTELDWSKRCRYRKCNIYSTCT